MRSHYPCHATAGNFNNHIGVPLTLLAMPEDTEIAIIEMGTNQPGDIDLLCRIAAPTHGVITNIGKEHLEGFGSIEGVQKAEGELYDYLQQHSGTVFVNRDEAWLTGMSRGLRHVDYGRVQQLRPADPGMIGVELTGADPFVQVAFLSEENERTEIRTHLPGLHNFNNIMTALALGTYFKVPAARIQTALAQYRPTNNRSQVLVQGSNTILLDAYNANPSSMVPALETLCRMKGQHKVAFLGDMLELGQESQAEHTALAAFAATLPLQQLVLVGTEFGRIPWQQYGALHFPNAAAARDWYQQQHFEGTDLLIKGSRGIRMETILNV
jgi:UDP-N-acetylmuramoyl-tripeptide--D-alanyl-D-alanine ligase